MTHNCWFSKAFKAIFPLKFINFQGLWKGLFPNMSNYVQFSLEIYRDTWKPSIQNIIHVATKKPELFSLHSKLGAQMIICTCVHVGVLCTKVPPLETIDRPQVALLSLCEPQVVQEGPRAVGLPNLHSFLWELLGICWSLWRNIRDKFSAFWHRQNLKGRFIQMTKK